MYYANRHAVDDNNNVRQGSAPLEESWGTKRWDIRQLCWIIALVETNALLAFNQFICKQRQLEPLSLVEFRKLIVKEALQHFKTVNEALASDSRIITHQMNTHVLKKKDEFCGIFSHGKWTKTKSKYQQAVCSGANCHARVRTYCVCDPTLVLCSVCFADHLAAMQ